MDRRTLEAAKLCWLENEECPVPGMLDADTCWALDLDPTGMSGDPRWPFTIYDLTDEERKRLSQEEIKIFMELGNP